MGSRYWLGLGMCTAALAGPPASRYDDSAVREAASAIYIHGMTETVAHEAFGPEAVPALVRLLAEPGFSHRDNVVVALGWLGEGPARSALLALLAAPPGSSLVAEEERALLLAPQSLGQIASRGDRAALEALLEISEASASGEELLARAAAGHPRPAAFREDLRHMARRGLGWSRAPTALSHLSPLAERGDRSAQQALDLARELEAPPPAAETIAESVIDGFHSRVHHAYIDFANHAALPERMTNSRLDRILPLATAHMGRANFPGDVACCAGVERLGSPKAFGFLDDGLDIIDSSAELQAVLFNPVARFKIVRLILWCGGSAPNAVGCGFIGGIGAVLERMSGPAQEGMLWAHEFGHNAGLPHQFASRTSIMYPQISATIDPASTGLTQLECDMYHAPVAAAAAAMVDRGACADGDGDEAHDLVDNCPYAANVDQADADADGPGNACDTCTDTDYDGFGDPGHDATTCGLDNCPGVANSGQSDVDADEQGDVCDCVPTVAGDGRVGSSLRLDRESGALTLTWSDDGSPGAFRLYHGWRRAGEAWRYNQYCSEDALAESVATQALAAQPNRLEFYLVTRAGSPGCPEPALGSTATGDDILGDGDCSATRRDPDGDGVEEAGDACPGMGDPLQEDHDADGHGDGCDNCPWVANFEQHDQDGDGRGDACDGVAFVELQ